MANSVWKVLGSSVVGNSHVEKGTGCQDASGWRRTSGVTCLAVADGAGSRPLSATGSALAVEQALATVARLALDENPPDDLTKWLAAAFDSARDRIDAFASSTERKAGEYATTLAVAILTDGGIAIGQVGDSIAVVGNGGRYLAVNPEVKGEYVNETFFLTAPDWDKRFRVAILAGAADIVALSTDGLRYKITNTRTGAPFEPFFGDLMGYAQGPEANSEGIGRFLASLENDQTGDDKSLVAAVHLTTQEDVAGDGGETWPAPPAAAAGEQPAPPPVAAHG